MKSVIKIFLIILITTPLFIRAQNSSSFNKKSKFPDSDRFFSGGDFGLLFGDVTLIEISPLLGYKFTDQLWGGVGGTYQYYKNSNYIPSFKSSVYGGRLFSRYYIGLIDNLFLHGEYEVLNYDAIFVDPFGYYYQNRITAHNILVGGGYSQPISDRSSIDLMILYNINENSQSLYSNPVVRVGFNFGL